MAEHESRQAPPRLLLIAPPNSYRTLAYLDAARRHGVDVLVASEGEFSLVSEIAGGLHIELSDPGSLERLLVANSERPFSGVVATDDMTVELGSHIAAALELPYNPPDAARFSRFKHLSRQTLAAAGVPVPAFRLLSLQAELLPQLEGFALPAVVKPLSLSGSRGVIRADTAEAVLSACERIRPILATETRDEFLRTHVLLESFVAGPEVAVEGLLAGGRLEVLAIFDKPDPLEGPFFEESYYITPSRHGQDEQRAIIECVADACAGLGLREGPVHAEVRLSEAGCVVIEVASRTIGGECARLLAFGTGHGLEDLVVNHAIGQPLPIEPLTGAAGVLMIPIREGGSLRRVEGITVARAVPYIEDILISMRDGYELMPLPEGSSYLGFMFARAPEAEQVEAALREAHAHLNVVVAPLMKIEDRRDSQVGLA